MSTGRVLMRSMRGALLGLAPIPIFYAAFKAWGVVWAVVIGAIASLAVLPIEAKLTGSKRFAWLGLAGVAMGAVVSAVTRDPNMFFLRSVIGDLIWGVALLGSLLIKRPLIGVFASWVVSIPDEYKQTPAYRRSFGIVTFVWGAVTLARGIWRAFLISDATLEGFLVLQTVTGWPVLALLILFAVWYPRRVARSFVASQGGDPALVDGVLLGAEQIALAEEETGGA